MKKYFYLILIAAAVMLNSCATSYYYNLPPKQFEEIDYHYTLKQVQVRNINVSYIDEGSGDQVLLLIHGLGTNAKSWMKNIPALSEKFRVIALDLPGYGKSDKGYYEYSMSFYAEFINEMLEELKIDEAVFIGHSMGAQISLIASLNYPERVSRMVLIAPAGFEEFTEGEGDWMKSAFTIDLIKDTPIRNIDFNLRANFYETPDDADFFVTDRIQIKGADEFEKYCYAVTRNVAGMIDEPVLKELNDIKHKTLILFGENDGLIPNAYLHGGSTRNIAEAAVSSLPNAELILVQECGHMLQFEKSDVANKAIIDFMNN